MAFVAAAEGAGAAEAGAGASRGGGLASTVKNAPGNPLNTGRNKNKKKTAAPEPEDVARRQENAKNWQRMKDEAAGSAEASPAAAGDGSAPAEAPVVRVRSHHAQTWSAIRRTRRSS